MIWNAWPNQNVDDLFSFVSFAAVNVCVIEASHQHLDELLVQEQENVFAVVG